MPRETAPASRAAPTPKIAAPIMIAFSLPTLSARWPAKKEVKAAGSRIEDTIRPCIVGEDVPNDSAKAGMAVTGPMIPVSTLDANINFCAGWRAMKSKPKQHPPNGHQQGSPYMQSEKSDMTFKKTVKKRKEAQVMGDHMASSTAPAASPKPEQDVTLSGDGIHPDNATVWDPTFLTMRGSKENLKDSQPIYGVIVLNQPIQSKRQLLSLCRGGIHAFVPLFDPLD
ncbi:MAG: hypothetical protein Q9210_004817 [Variospora velana]